MNWMLLPPWSFYVPFVGAAVLAALLVWRVWSEKRLVPAGRQWPAIGMRVAVIGVLLFVALNPMAVFFDEGEGKPRLIVLLDTSSSMSFEDVEGRGRLEAVLQTLDPAMRAELNEQFDLDTRTFDRDVQAADYGRLDGGAARGRASNLSLALNQAVNDLAESENRGGVLVIGDGRATTGGVEEAAQLALARSVPLWTWTVGGEVDRRDLWIQTPTGEVLAFAGDPVQLEATLHQSGYPNRSFHVELLEGDRVIARKEVTPGSDGSGSFSATIKAPDQGEKQYRIRVPVDRDEAESQNNQRSVYVKVVGQKVRVLVVEGQPHWDTKFLVQSLKRNPRVEVTALYRLSKGRSLAVVSTNDRQTRKVEDLFPRTAEAFGRYDVIVFGRRCETFFGEETEDLLTDFVARHGGSLVFARGKSYAGRFEPLAKFEPVVWGEGARHGVRLMPVGAARRGGVFQIAGPEDLDQVIDRLPRFDRVARTSGIKPLAEVLARGRTVREDEEGPPATLMAYQLYGQGRVATINASGLWRWSFRKKGQERDEQVYDRFWLGLMRWLLSGSDFASGHDVALRADRRLYTDRQPIRILVRTRGLDREAYRPRLTLQGEGRTVNLEPRPSGTSYLAEAAPMEPGHYQLVLKSNIGRPETLKTNIQVVSGSIENRQLSAQPALMKQIAESTGGRAIDGSDLDNLPSMVRRWKASQQLADRKQPLWDRAWLLLGLLGLLSVEWFTRRREGLT
ncbi:MAG: VWA domain-containing protein [Phycisphaeraceae bacterium]|nr:VWA domain-containing protein [Phycisphaeraceae bacterium]